MKNNQENLNKIVNAQNAEIRAAEEARKAAEEAAMINAVQPKTILDMIEDIYAGKLLIITDECDNIVGINCPTAVKGVVSTQKIGYNMIMGENEANMHEDYIELQKFMRAYSGQNIQHMFNVALLITNAQIHPTYAELINYKYYFVVNEWKKVIDEDGNTIIDVNEQIPGEINQELLTSILVDKLHLLKL